jgi:hypothetical protein
MIGVAVKPTKQDIQRTFEVPVGMPRRQGTSKSCPIDDVDDQSDKSQMHDAETVQDA